MRCEWIRPLFKALVGAVFVFAGGDPVHSGEGSITINGEIKVFDGDTLEVGPLLIRLHGIDAPEKGQSCDSKSGSKWKCGAEATNRLADLLSAGPLSCEALDRDHYGRIISRCSVGGHDVAARLVKEGLAWAFVAYSRDYVGFETEAREQALGVWQAE